MKYLINPFRRFILISSLVLLTACGGSESNSTSSSATSALPQSSNSSSSSVVLVRKKIDLEKASFFKEPGLWVAFTQFNQIVRVKTENGLSPFQETRLSDTSLNSFIFVPDTNALVPGDCVRQLDPAEVKDGFRNMLFTTSIAAELYCVTEDSLFEENDGSYTVEYRCDKKLVGTTRLVKKSAHPEFDDIGLTINSRPIKPVCPNWNISKFEIWSLDINGNEISQDASAGFNQISLRTGTGDDSSVISFTDHLNPWRSNSYQIWKSGSLASNEVVAHISPANAGMPWIEGTHFGADGGSLTIDRVMPLQLSGSFNLKSGDDIEVSGSFIFDYTEYFEE
jgi:hypothetical protein